jgi:hypothetical protein
MQNYSKSFVTLRAIIIALLLILVNSHWQTYLSSTLDIELTDLSLFSNVISILFVLVLLNYGIKWLFERSERFAVPLTKGGVGGLSLSLPLWQGELLTIYVMLATATALNGTDMIKCLVSLVSNGSWYATVENDWGNLFGKYLPNWLTISDRQILKGYYEGESTFYVDTYIKAWLPRAVVWSSFTVVLIFIMLCINTIVRKEWVRNERLTYPVAQLPFEMTQDSKNLNIFSNKLMWIGFSIAAFISIVNQMHILYPVIPGIPVQPISLSQYFRTKPWNAMSSMYRSFYPFAIGLGYLMPLDLIMSTWFFHLFWQAERILGSAIGFAGLPQFPYASAQVRGAWVGLLLYAIWIGKKYFLNALKEIFKSSKADTSGGPITYRNAILGIIASFVFLITFCYYAGMSIWVILLFFFIYFALCTTITRIRAELGPPVHNMSGATQDEFLLMFCGTRRIGPQNLTGFGLLYWICGYAGRENPMPIQLEAFKLAERLNMKPKRLLYAILIAALIGSLSGFWGYLHDAYKVGVESYPEQTWAASVGYRLLESRLQNPTGWQPLELTFTGIGFLFTVFLLMMRTRFLWWSFHPVGYAISGEWGIGRIFFPLIIASTIKWGTLRFAGLRGYRRSIPFFLGLIIGDFVLGCVWATISIFCHIPVYVYWTG